MSAVRVDVRGTPIGTLIDRADLELITGFEWYLTSNGYVATQRGSLIILLHRLIAGAGPDEVVDHHNMDTLDNRSCNLRRCSHSQNGANRGADRRRLGTTSRHKGVSWQQDRQRWVAYIHVNGKTRFLGRFKTEESAALAYNEAAIDAWGDFARLNELGVKS